MTSFCNFCESPPTFGAPSATDSRSAVVRSRSGFWWAATTVITNISSLNIVAGASSILKLPQQIWKTVRQFWGSCIRSTVDPSDWRDGSPSPQTRPPKPALSCGRSDIYHGCVGWGERILLGQIHWHLCCQGASTWRSVVICEVWVRCQVYPSIFYTYSYLE